MSLRGRGRRRRSKYPLPDHWATTGHINDAHSVDQRQKNNIKGKILSKFLVGFEWKILDFFSLPLKLDYYIESPSFPYLEETWYLRCYPNGNQYRPGWIDLFLDRKHSTSKRNITCRLGIKREDGFEYISGTGKTGFETNDQGWGAKYLVQRNSLLKDKKLVASENEITFFCSFLDRPKEDDVCQTAATWQTIISQLYETKKNADVRIMVNKRIFKAHRFVLVMRIPEFSRILTSFKASVYTLVDAESVTEVAFDILLRFLYTGTLGTTNKQSIVEAYRCGLAYQVADLQEKCQEEMKAWDITTEEIFSLLDFGLNVPTLRNKCMSLLRTEGRVALSHPAFLKISSKCLRYVLEGGVLENVSVFERIEHIIEWCVHPHAEGTNYADARNKLLDDRFLGRLEFEKLELKELTLVLSRYQGLITPEELMCFLKYKHTKDASVLPDWCLTSSIGSSQCKTRRIPKSNA